MVREVNKEEADELIAENRHRELASALKAISTALSKDGDKEIVDAIKLNGAKFDELSKSINIKSPINGEVNTKDFVTSILLIRDEIVESNKKAVIAYESAEKSNIKLIETLNTRLLPDTFTIVKDSRGTTESVKVNYKQANKITIKT